MDVIDISSGSDNEMDDRQNNNPNSVFPGFLGTSHKQTSFEAPASNSQHGRLKSQESGRAQIGSEAMSYSAGLPRGSHAKSHHDVNINNSAGPTENFTGHEFHPQIKHQRHGSQSGNVFQVENDSGTISSDDNSDFRRLPHSLLPGPEIDIYGGSRLNRSDEDKNRRAKASLGSASNLYQESVHMGIDSKLGLGSVGNNVGKMIDEQRFQHHEDPHVPKLDKRFLPASFLNTMPRTESKTSPVENGIAGPRYDVHGKYNNENSADRAFYMGDSYGNGNDDDVTIYKVAKQRVLPPTFTTSGRHVTGTNPANSSGVPQYTGGEEMQAQYDETPIYQAALQDLSQPKVEADVPDGVLTVSLLRHQKIALSWMVQKETAGPNCLGGFLADDQGLGKTVSTIALIQMQRPRQPEATSSNLQSKKFEPLNLDEDDDILSELEKTMQDSEVIEKKWENTSMEASSCKGRPAAGTLIVCPASVLRQWSRELDEKVTQQAKLSILIYHGSNRTRDPTDLASYDVVLTTYAIVSNEVPKQPLADDDGEERNMEKYGLEPSTNKKRKKASNAGKKAKKRKKGMDGSIDYESGPLARVAWFRVVLDEAQTIKNHRTQVARACCGLRAKRRWCLSGTPIQNAIDDLYSYFRFLRYDPYAVYKSFCTSIKYPISRNLINGYKKLQAVLKAIMLRRTKDTLIEGKPILLLPPKSICLKKVDFSSEERTFYSSLEADSRSQFKKYAEAGTLSQNYANILLLLLRLRQACDHPLLAEGFRSHSTGKASLEMARYLPREMLTNLFNLLEPSLAICGVCRDPPEDAVVTMCGHVFCYQCVSDRLAGDDNFCPADECKDQLGPESTFSRATLLSCISDEPEDNNSNGASSSRTNDEVALRQNTGSSSKIKAVLEILHSVCKVKIPTCTINSNEWNGTPFSPETINDSKLSVGSSAIESQLPDKAIVFSQWTSMLDLLEISLRNSCITFRRLDGTMSLASRDKAVKDFITNPEVAVMIMSLKAGNLGLNMVAANHVILLDLWWNPTTEDQAIDRAHRIGQTRPVTVSRLTVKDTVEDRILALQEEKRKMVSSAFGEDQTGGSATRLTVEDLTYLFMGGSL